MSARPEAGAGPLFGFGPGRVLTMTNDTADLSLPHDWNRRMVLALDAVARRGRWDVALVWIGAIHFGFCLVLHQMHIARHPIYWHFLALWFVDFASTFVVMRRVAGKGWAWGTPLAGIVLRVWITFGILAFNVAALNVMTGPAVDWFKLAWATLSAFVFMVMAYLISSWFFGLAVQMYFTGLLMVRFPTVQYPIFGASWLLCLLWTALFLRWRWSGTGGSASESEGA